MTHFTLLAIFAELAIFLRSPEFLVMARHPDHPTAFSRTRKLPLPTLVVFLLSALKQSIPTELDGFFAAVKDQAMLVRVVTEQAFSQARAKLSLTAIPQLNAWLVARAEQAGAVKRWRGLRLVAADASTVRFGLRASNVKHAALADQILFALFLPGSELMLAAALHAVKTCGERQMLFQQLDILSSTDLLLLDRGYPACWMVAVLNQRGIPFCVRVEVSGNGA
jgi:hypothetical protein